MNRNVDFEVMIGEHQKDVWRYLRMLGCSPAEADDLTQDVFLSVMRSEFEPRSRGETAAYLRTSAGNLFLNALRKHSRNVPFDVMADAEGAWRDATPEEGSDARLEALKTCLETLDGRQRQILHLRYEERRSGNDIARALSTTEEGVYSLLKRVRTILRECIEKKVRP